jgi:hypothetical protein
MVTEKKDIGQLSTTLSGYGNKFPNIVNNTAVSGISLKSIVFGGTYA